MALPFFSLYQSYMGFFSNLEQAMSIDSSNVITGDTGDGRLLTYSKKEAARFIVFAKKYYIKRKKKFKREIGF
jgi:hypothetical protein